MNEELDYTWGVVSTNDPSPVSMKYHTKEQAQRYAEFMNSLIDSWEENPDCFWNKEHWKVKPEPWISERLVR